MKTAVILNDTSYDSHHGCETVMGNIVRLLNEQDIHVIDTNSVKQPWQENQRFVDNLKKSDIVIINGEGTLTIAKKKLLTWLLLFHFPKI